MADQDGTAPPLEDVESAGKTNGRQVSEPALNGLDKVVNNNEDYKRHHGKSRNRHLQNNSSRRKRGNKRGKKVKGSSPGNNEGLATAGTDTSSSEDESDTESESEFSSGELKTKKKQKKINPVGRGKGKSKLAGKPSKSKKKASNQDLARDQVESDSSSSSSSSDSDSDLGVSDANKSDKEHVLRLESQATELTHQIKELQLVATQLQQLYTSSTQPPYMQTPQAPLQDFGLGQNTGRPTHQPPRAAISQPQFDNGQQSNTWPNRPPPAILNSRRRLQNNLDQAIVEPLSGAKDPGEKAQPKRQKQGDPKRPEFKRVDWVWDTTNYSYKLQDSVEASTTSQYDGFVFHVRRIFDPDGKYRKTTIDIKSKLLRECLQEVMGNPKGVSLVDETPKLDPNLLFLYLDDFRQLQKLIRKMEPSGKTKKQRRKNQERLDQKRKHLKVLLKYLDADYDKVKSSLNPMLRNGLITFDLLWALWKPGTLGYSHTYGNSDMPRVFKVEAAERHITMHKGEFYYLDGKYLEFDGKRFGFGHVSEEILEFKGARKITSLPCYPLSYCSNEEQVREKLIARGKKFVSLSAMHYKAYTGMAFMKRKKAIIRFNVQNSRIMIDPATFRRINPNYYVSQVRSKDPDALDDDSSDDGLGNDSSSESSDDGGGVRMVSRMLRDANGKIRMIQVPRGHGSDDKNGKQSLAALPQEETADGTVDDAGKTQDGEAGAAVQAQTEGTGNDSGPQLPANDNAENGGSKVQDNPEEEKQPVDPLATVKAQLTDDEYLVASPVVLGFSFSEKQWLEFSIDDVSDIKWNDKAWDSLVLEAETKRLIKALVESRKYNPATTIDDVIQGKGKGLVAVLHGPPGTGKTLTAEGISELLKCPLYMASAGELGTDSRFLEHELDKILDICHTWGAILLLDEADVFLEKRNMQDIHRNALVSIFLRQLEYFQGILFLTTNRVETFDEAFQSRIHVALRYDKLDMRAKKAIFQMFIDRVRAYGRMKIDDFSDSALNALAKRDLNGREIKNVMGSAQDLAINNKEPLGLKHIQQVLDVHAKFGRDLKGGPGFEDAMRSYF